MRFGGEGAGRLMRDREEPFPYDPGYRIAVLLGERPFGDLPAWFGVVTAHNPWGRVVSDEENVRADERLIRRVEEMGVEHFRVAGASPDRVHCEEGFGVVGLDLDRVCELSREFHQQAFFWVTGGWVFVCDDASGGGWRAGRLEERYHWVG